MPNRSTYSRQIWYGVLSVDEYFSMYSFAYDGACTNAMCTSKSLDIWIEPTNCLT